MRGTEKMIFAIKPFEIHDGDGIRTTVFFKGCPLRCKWCHNPESLSFKREMLFDPALCRDCLACVSLCDANTVRDKKHIFLRTSCIVCGQCVSLCPNRAFEAMGMDMTAEEIAAEVLKDEIFMKNSGGGVTFSGGEPLGQVELCIGIAEILKTHGINLAIDTSCAVPRAAIDRILPYADSFLIDIKAIDEATHIACTGVSNKNILENILYIDRLGIPMEIRYPYIPTMNDGEAERIAAFVMRLNNLKTLRILPYHNYAERKYECLGIDYPLPHVPIPTADELAEAESRMRKTGLRSIAAF